LVTTSRSLNSTAIGLPTFLLVKSSMRLPPALSSRTEAAGWLFSSTVAAASISSDPLAITSRFSR
jgi:hypothetical protein